MPLVWCKHIFCVAQRGNTYVKTKNAILGLGKPRENRDFAILDLGKPRHVRDHVENHWTVK